MKAEMGRKLSKRQGYAPIQAAKRGIAADWATGAQKKTPAEAPGFEVCRYGGKAVGQAYCTGARDRAGGAPCG